MEINIQFMTESAYLTLQKNAMDVFHQIMIHPFDGLWLKEYLGFEPFEEKSYCIDDFELKIADSYEKVSFQNSILIYKHLKHLPRYILCNPRFWAWLTFFKFYKVALNCSGNLDSSIILNNWLINNTRKSLMMGILSRYFFLVEMSIEENLEEPYELTKYLLSNMETYRSFSYRNIGMLKNITLAVLRAQKDICEKNGVILDANKSALMVKETSKIGSVMLVDVMSAEEIYELIYPKFLKIAL